MAKTPEEQRAKRVEWYAANRESQLAKRAAKRAADPEYFRAQHAADHAKHREERLQKMSDYYHDNRDELLAKMKIHRLEHLEEKKAYLAQYYIDNYQEVRSKQNAHAAQHREEANERSSQWRKDNPELASALKKRHRARKKGAPVNDFTAEQWQEMQEICQHCCIYCGEYAKGQLEQDHLTPLSKGGSHTWTNILPACRSCNSRKHAGPVLSPVQPLLL